MKLVYAQRAFLFLAFFFWSVLRGVIDPPTGYIPVEDGLLVRYGDVIQLKHKESELYLHARNKPYYHAKSSKQQQITCAAQSSDAWWVVLGPDGSDFDALKGKKIDLQQPLRLQQIDLGVKLHSHSFSQYGFTVPSGDTDLQEVTAKETTLDPNDNWRITVDGGGSVDQGAVLILIHDKTSRYLRSEKGTTFSLNNGGDSKEQVVGACLDSYKEGESAEADKRRWIIDQVARPFAYLQAFQDAITLDQADATRFLGVPDGYVAKMPDETSEKTLVSYGDLVRLSCNESFLHYSADRYADAEETDLLRQVYCLPPRDIVVNRIALPWKQSPLIRLYASWWRLDPLNDPTALGAPLEDGNSVRAICVCREFMFQADTDDVRGLLYSDPAQNKKSPAGQGQRIGLLSRGEGKDENFVFTIKKRAESGTIEKGAEIGLLHKASQKYITTKTGSQSLYAGQKDSAKALQEVFLDSLISYWTIESVAEASDAMFDQIKQQIFTPEEEDAQTTTQPSTEGTTETTIVPVVTPTIPLNLAQGFAQQNTIKMQSISVGSSSDGLLVVWGIGQSDGLLYRYKAGGMSSGFSQVAAHVAADGSMSTSTELTKFSSVSISSFGQVYAVADGQVYCYKEDKNSWIQIPAPANVRFDQVEVGGIQTATVGVSTEVKKDVVWARTDKDQLFQLGTDDAWQSRTTVGVAIDLAVSADNIVLAVNNKNLLFEYKSETNSWIDVAEDFLLAMVSAGNKENIYGVTTDGVLVTVDVDTQSIKKLLGANGSPATGFLEISVNAAGTVVALDKDGIVYKKGDAGVDQKLLLPVKTEIAVKTEIPVKTEIQADTVTAKPDASKLTTPAPASPGVSPKLDIYKQLKPTANTNLVSGQGQRAATSSRQQIQVSRRGAVARTSARTPTGRTTSRTSAARPSVGRSTNVVSSRAPQFQSTRGQASGSSARRATARTAAPVSRAARGSARQ